MEPTRLSVGYTSVIDLGRAARSEYPHTLGDYPTKILPQVVGAFVERFTHTGDLVCEPSPPKSQVDSNASALSGR